MMYRILLLFLVVCCGVSGIAQAPITPSDARATKETRALYANLHVVAERRILFGHEDAMAYGVGWKEYHKCRTDVHDVCGKHPAVFGWDVSKLGKSGYNIDHVDFKRMRGWIKRAFRMGAINTISWHMDNWLTGGNAWDHGEQVVTQLLPGGTLHQTYSEKLDLFAEFVQELRVGFLFKKDVPIIFRPFHEHTGNWFWWGQPHCTPEEYKQLWQFTVHYLRDVKGLHNLLYAYSPDVFRDREHYLECYPGDAWVDVLGLDDYHDVGPDGNSQELVRRLRIIVELANEKAKVAALTETGLESIPQNDWWTTRLLNPIKGDPEAARIAWLLVWRNARPSHHYAPYPGHASVPDFLKFSADPVMLFQSQLPKMYRLE